jgi:hypothetical protein
MYLAPVRSCDLTVSPVRVLRAMGMMYCCIQIFIVGTVRLFLAKRSANFFCEAEAQIFSQTMCGKLWYVQDSVEAIYQLVPDD